MSLLQQDLEEAVDRQHLRRLVTLRLAPLLLPPRSLGSRSLLFVCLFIRGQLETQRTHEEAAASEGYRTEKRTNRLWVVGQRLLLLLLRLLCCVQVEEVIATGRESLLFIKKQPGTSG